MIISQNKKRKLWVKKRKPECFPSGRAPGVPCFLHVSMQQVANPVRFRRIFLCVCVCVVFCSLTICKLWSDFSLVSRHKLSVRSGRVPSVLVTWTTRGFHEKCFTEFNEISFKWIKIFHEIISTILLWIQWIGKFGNAFYWIKWNNF